MTEKQYLARDTAKEHSDSAKPDIFGAVTQLFSLSNRLCILRADERRTLYSTALLSAEHLFVRASSLASCKQFSRFTQFIYIKI
jgi:hypothetical protein